LQFNYCYVANKHRQFDLEKIMDSKLMGKYLIIIAVIITFISSSEANVVSIFVSDSPLIKGAHDRGYSISGEITSLDLNQVKNIVQRKGAWDRLYFRLNSSGGDIYAAMEIGKLIRKARGECVVPKGEKCYSACVFVLAGAVKRFVAGEVGIHRPYSTYVGKRDYESTQNEYRRTETAVRVYLREMNLPAQLFEAMVVVPPEKIRILSDKELEAFGLSGTDPVEQDTEDATDASKYGISKTEYLLRKASVDKVCPAPLLDSDFSTQKVMAWHDCHEAYMYGVSIPAYKARVARAKDACSRYKGDPKEFDFCWDGVLQGNR
jgi:ATP-dependent protease ClpP protease subunit